MKKPYIIKRIAILKMPGFPSGMEIMENFSPNINIILGPNASGKSSTARAIQQVIWQNKAGNLIVEASVGLSTDFWEIRIDHTSVSIQRNGQKDEFTGIPAREGKDRYYLALHELIIDNENNLAAEILKQSIGGFDLEAAKTNLGYSGEIKNRGAGEYKHYKLTEENCRRISGEQRDLKKQEVMLESLNQSREDAEAARSLGEFFEKLVQLLEMKMEVEQFALQLDDFPAAMDRISGGECLKIEELEIEIEDADNSIEFAKREIATAEQALKRLKVPQKGAGRETIFELEGRIASVQDLERKLRETNIKVSEAKTRELEALKIIDGEIDMSRWRPLRLEDISVLEKLFQDSNQVQGEKELLIAEMEALSRRLQSTDNPLNDPEKLLEGIKTLANWLKEQTYSGAVPLWSATLLATLAVLIPALTFIAGWTGLLGIILVVLVFLFVLLKYSGEGKNSTAQIREKDFLRSGLAAPGSWEIEQVSERIDELITDLKHGEDVKAIVEKLQNCKVRLEKTDKRLDQVKKLRDKLLAELGVAPELAHADLNNFATLYWFIKHAKDWQDARMQLQVLQSQRHVLQEQTEGELAKCYDLFQSLNFQQAADSMEAKSILEEIKHQETIRNKEVVQIEQKRKQIEDLQKVKVKAQDKLNDIYHLLEVETGSKQLVRTLVEKLEPYRQLCNDHYAAQQQFLKHHHEISAHSHYTKYKEEVEKLTVDQAKERLNACKVKSVELEKIQRHITEIETLVKEKTRGHELEDILNLKEEALEKLAALYERNLSSVTGSLIVEQLKEETRQQNQPKVLKRANELFNRITNGRYELRLQEKDKPGFLAYDTVLRLGQDLSEISTGTRVQLLLSVRLAYVETQESLVKIPILADELLANSDEERAKAIVEALTEISRDGRQVFYFTAQPDEVSKWNVHLRNHPDLQCSIISLKNERGNRINHSELDKEFHRISLFQKVAPAHGESHESYGQKIGVSPFDVLHQECSELSLWYLTQDVPLLYGCFRKGIKCWGQLESYLKHGGFIENFTAHKLLEMKEKIQVLERFMEIYRKGRNKPVDKQTLTDSCTVSPSFIDEVGLLLKEIEGDPEKLIHALRNGEVPRFRQTNIEALEEFLIRENYLTDEPSLTPAEVVIQLSALTSRLDIEADDAEAFLNAVLHGSRFSKNEVRHS